MSAAVLGDIANGTDVFLDANVIIHAVTDASAQCKSLLERCSREEVFGISSFSTLAEVTHRLMMMEAVSKGIASLKKAKERLNQHPEDVRRLSSYWEQVRRVLAMNLLFVSVDSSVTLTAQKVRLESGLLTNDSLIVATMREYGIRQLATQDKGFEAASAMAIFRADDV